MTACRLLDDPQTNTQTLSTFLDIDCTIPIPADFRLEAADLCARSTVQARITGPANAPVVLVLGGISANRNVIDSNTQTGWWRDAVGENGALDLQRFRILSFDFFPGSETREEPVDVTPGDQAGLAKVVCNYFNIGQLHALIGYSYGGMVALHFGALFPERVKQLIVCSASHRAHPMGTAWRSIQRKIVQFGLETDQADRALSLARELGMTTYRTAEEFGLRFSNDQFGVEEYLSSRGEAFVGKMTPQRYLSLSRSIDLHQVDPAQIHVPTTLIGFKQDQLILPDEMRELNAQLPCVKGCHTFDSIYGHDGFLKETGLLSEILKNALENEYAKGKNE